MDPWYDLAQSCRAQQTVAVLWYTGSGTTHTHMHMINLGVPWQVYDALSLAKRAFYLLILQTTVFMCHLFHTQTLKVLIKYFSQLFALVSMSISVSSCLASSQLTVNHPQIHTLIWLTESLVASIGGGGLSALCSVKWAWFGETSNQLLLQKHTHTHTYISYIHNYTCTFVCMINRERWINSSLFNEISPRRTKHGQDCDVSLPQNRETNHLCPPLRLRLKSPDWLTNVHVGCKCVTLSPLLRAAVNVLFNKALNLLNS